MESHIGEFLKELSLKPEADKLEVREYQINIARSILGKGNSLVIMPTALGKTFVSVFVMAKLVREMREGKRERKKFLFLAPTKPLAAQQAKRLHELIDFGPWEKEKLIEGESRLGKEKEGSSGMVLEGKESAIELEQEDRSTPAKKKEEEKISEVMLLTGEMAPGKRELLWKKGEVWCYAATPQTVEFDVLAGRVRLEDFALIVFDEAHRAVKEYSYSFVAREAGKRGIFLIGLTASPSSRREVIDEICMNLGVRNIEIRDELDFDVRKYAHQIKMDWVFVGLPAELRELRDSLQEMLREVLEELKRMGVLGTIDYRAHKRELLMLRQRAISALQTDPINYQVLSLHARAMNLSHAIDLVEIDGVHSLLQFMKDMETRERQSKAVKLLLNDPRWLGVQLKCLNLVEQGMEHPKFSKLREIMGEEMREGKKIIVFAHFRNTVKRIVEELGKMGGLKPVGFIGKSNEGMGQKQQQHVMQQFREGEYNVLVATSVGEEGLDIPEVELVVFFEAVPSEIRLIQRRGRTGRVKEGKAIILVTKGSKDETFFWSSRRKEKKMREVVEGIRREGLVGVEEQNEYHSGNQSRIFDY
ncbi:MAG: helicase-related protein [Candidatus Micrarchaeota archaeon]